MRYRVNYGQGQVSQTFGTRKEADTYITACKRDARDPYSAHYFVEFQDDGWWFPAPRKKESGEAPRRSRAKRHHVDRPQDQWDVVQDAIARDDPETAARIARELQAEHGKVALTRSLKRVLHDAPSTVRERFEELMGWDHKPGKAEFEEKAPGVMTLYIPGHGHFSAPVLTYHKYKRMPRAKLVKMMLQIYDGAGYHGGKGDKAAHWRGYDKDYLAMIAADAYGSDSDE